MELRELNTFLHVAKFKSFSKAAQYLDYSQAAVTIQIKQLEHELGISLFDRIGKQISLTHQGDLFFVHASRILRDVKEATDSLSAITELTGTLSIGVIDSISASLLPPILCKFHELYPKTNVKVMLDSPNILLQRMNNNTIDLVFFLDQKLYDPKWEKVLEEPENVIFVSPTSSPLAGKKDISFEELLTQPFLLTEKNASYRFVLDQYLAALGLEIHPFLESGSTDFLLRVLRKTSPAITFLPEFTVHEDIKRGILCALSVKDFQMHIWRQIVHHKDKYVTKEMKAFIELACRT